MKKILLLLSSYVIVTTAIAQEETSASTRVDVGKLKTWYLADRATNGIQGISLDSAYYFLQSNNKKSKTIVVCVLDSGVDTTHVDLKNVLWRNPKEIPNNNIDDDKNGYVDDVYGWNFLGNKNGENIEKGTYEKSRFYFRYKKQYENKKIDTAKLSPEEKHTYLAWKKIADGPAMNEEDSASFVQMQYVVPALTTMDSILQITMKKQAFTEKDLEQALFPTELEETRVQYLSLMQAISPDPAYTNTALMDDLKKESVRLQGEADWKTIAPIDLHATIVKDNYSDFNDTYYGNPNVMAGGDNHGTHVAGIIAAARNNSIGINGIADNVKVMSVRVVPDGDEYDKDVAVGIRYAVDNGAKIINMSFGKSYSPEKKWVDEAFKYAASKDVLIIHAAGNEHANSDSVDTYPNPIFLDGSGEAPNVITVGASTDPSIDVESSNSYVTSFSNYGIKTVDVFAPGWHIYSTIPKGNAYAFEDGTSMAAPVVTGIATLIRSYYPNFTAIEVKKIIETSVMRPSASLKNVCKAGGIVNAYRAIIMADTMARNKQ